MYNIFKRIPVTDVFLDCFWAFAPEPQQLHQYKQLPSIYKHQITVTEKSTFIVRTGPCLCLVLGLWSVPLRLLRRSLRVLHTKHPLEENLCFISVFWTLFLKNFLLADLITMTINSHLRRLESLCVCSMILWSCWMAAGWSPKSTGLPASWIIPSSSIRPGSSSTWTWGCGTWPSTTTAATWRQCPTTPSSRVRRCPSARVITCLEEVNSCDCTKMSIRIKLVSK